MDLGCVRATVLAGTHAWGGLLLERTTRRPLLPILGRPLISHIFEWFANAGITRASVCANGDTPILRRQLRGSCQNVQIDYYQDVMPRGPAGSLRDSGIDTDDNLFVVMDASTLPGFNLRDLLEAHHRSGAVATVVTMPSQDAGIVRSDLPMPAGIYVCSRSVLEYIQQTGYQDIKEGLLSDLYAKGEQVVTYGVSRDEVLCVRDVSSYVRANHAVLVRSLMSGRCATGYRRADQAWIHQTAQVHPTARIIGPAMIGPGVTVGAGTVLIGPVVAGAGCKVGERAVVSRSILWKNCCLHEGASVDSAVLADRVQIGRNKAVRSRVLFASAEAKRAQSTPPIREGEDWDAFLDPIPAQQLPLSSVTPGMFPVTNSRGATQIVPTYIGATQPTPAESH